MPFICHGTIFQKPFKSQLQSKLNSLRSFSLLNKGCLKSFRLLINLPSIKQMDPLYQNKKKKKKKKKDPYKVYSLTKSWNTSVKGYHFGVRLAYFYPHSFKTNGNTFLLLQLQQNTKKATS